MAPQQTLELPVRLVICDLDGTLLDSDEALADAFVSLGVDRADITYGHVIAEECTRLGLRLEDYVAAYDTERAQPFDGVVDMLARLPRWAVCSNKHPSSGNAELMRLGWQPAMAMFAGAFPGPKAVDLVLASLAVPASEALFLGDTGHDRLCATTAGIRFALAGWNSRAVAEPGDLVLSRPADLVQLLGLEG